MNTERIKEIITKQIADYFNKSKCETAVIGISGGVDSAVVAALCVDALHVGVIGVEMPYGDQSTVDSSELISNLGIPAHRINIKQAVDSLVQVEDVNNNLIIGNVKARVRMIQLYSLASKMNGLVIGTSNKTEMKIGYFTKYGDGGCDIEPIADLYKTEIWELAKTYPAIPVHIISKPPSAELWDGQTDEQEIGMSYAELDKILMALEFERMESVVERFGADKVNFVVKKVSASQHKREMPPTFKVPIFEKYML